MGASSTAPSGGIADEYSAGAARDLPRKRTAPRSVNQDAAWPGGAGGRAHVCPLRRRRREMPVSRRSMLLVLVAGLLLGLAAPAVAGKLTKGEYKSVSANAFGTRTRCLAAAGRERPSGTSGCTRAARTFSRNSFKSGCFSYRERFTEANRSAGATGTVEGADLGETYDAWLSAGATRFIDHSC